MPERFDLGGKPIDQQIIIDDLRRENGELSSQLAILKTQLAEQDQIAVDIAEVHLKTLRERSYVASQGGINRWITPSGTQYLLDRRFIS